MKSLSYWEVDYFKKAYDLIIVGGGLVGTLAAIQCKKQTPKMRILVVERAGIPQGASTKNAGFGCYGSIGEILDDFEIMPAEHIQELVEMRFKGLEALQNIIPTSKNIISDCKGHELFMNQESFEKAADSIHQINALLSSIDSKLFQIEDQGHSTFYKKMITTPFEKQIHPFKALKALHKYSMELGVEWLFGTTVSPSFEKHQQRLLVKTNNDITLTTSNILLATNGFTKKLLPELDIIPVRNQVLITSPITNLTWNGNFHVERGYIYFRNVQNRILLGGARHISENEATSEFGNTLEIMDYLTAFLKKHILPKEDFSIENQWSGILGIGKQKTPIVREVEPNIFVAARLSGMGVAISSLIAKRISKMITL